MASFTFWGKKKKKPFGTHCLVARMGLREEENLFFLPGIEPPVRNLVITMTEVPRRQCNMRTFHKI